MTAEFNEDRFNMAIRKFLKHVGITSQREIENLVRSGEVKGGKLKLRMTLSAEGTPLKHVVEETVALRQLPWLCRDAIASPFGSNAEDHFFPLAPNRLIGRAHQVVDRP